MSDKGLISKTYKELTQFNIKIINNPIKMGKTPGYTFFKRRHIDDQQAHENMLSMINHEGNANQTTMRYHLTPGRMAIKKSTNNKCWRGVEKREHPCTVGGNVN